MEKVSRLTRHLGFGVILKASLRGAKRRGNPLIYRLSNQNKTLPYHLSQTILNRLFGRVLQKEGIKKSRHTELVSASQVNPLLSLRDTCLVTRVKRQFRILPQSLWLFAKLLQPRLAIRLPQGRENTLCAIPTSKSTKSSPMSTGRATCVAHDKNLSTYHLNVLKTDKNPSLTTSHKRYSIVCSAEYLGEGTIITY